MLTEEAICSVQAGAKPKKFYDTKGLYLWVTPSGGRHWHFKYRFPPRDPNSKENCISLGSYPEIRLEQARERRDLARKDVANYLDPKLRRICRKICLGNSFEMVAREFIAVLRAASIKPEGHSSAAAALIEQAERPTKGKRRQRVAISADTVDLMERRLELHVFPYIGEQEVQLVQPPDLLAVLRRVEERGNYNLAHRLRAICSRVFRFARATGRRCDDVAADLIGSLTPVVCEHMAAIIEPEKIGALLRSIEVYRGPPLTRLALKLVPYIFPRPIEFRHMEWSQIQLHGVSPEWRVPWRRMKMREPHIVPLSRQAVAILREIHQLTGRRRWVFPQIRNRERPMCEGCLTVALRMMGYDGAEMTWHGFRALASTQLHELGWHDLWIETQLAHGDRKKVRASYNHARYLPQRRTMMQAWADYLDSLRAGTEIAVSSEVGQRAALTASDAFQYVDADRALVFQAQAMEALRAILLMCPRR